MSRYDPHREPTAPHRRRHDIPPASSESLDATQPHRPVYDYPRDPYPVTPLPPPPPPLRPPRLRRRRGPGCFATLVKLALASSLFICLFSALYVGLYIIAPPPRTNILILGLDSRPGEGNVTRTDTMILATIDPDQPYVGMLSLPRDLYVDIPGYGKNRINSAHILGETEYEGGGVDLAVKTVEQNFGVPVHRTVRLNFEGFIAIIDAAGGVTIDVPEGFIDYEYPTPDYGTTVVSFEAGEQHMDGERALQYTRIRHGSSDFARAERQQQVLSALVKQLTRPENWWRLPGVYLAILQNIDTDLTPLDIALLGPAVVWVGPDGIDRQVLSQGFTSNETLDNGAEVVMPDWDAINALVEVMFRQ